ncbi:MAG: Trm112 family protein [Ignavibacteriae bacterium]|nr:Trm112 family protein [Ignavibacteriota bacterium]
MLTPELLSVLCCTVCKSDLNYRSEKNLLCCTSCGQEYQIKDNIPIMIVDKKENEHE